MMDVIRPLQTDDLPVIKAWCDHYGLPFENDRLPESTYVFVRDGVLVMSASLLVTNSPERSFVEFALANPEVKERDGVLMALFDVLRDLSKKMGFRKLYVLSPDPKLSQYFSDLGGKVIFENVALIREESEL